MSFVWTFASADSPALARPIMRRSSFLKPLLATLAPLFAAATILYTALWMYNARWQLPVELGFDDQYLEAEHCELVKSVQRGSSVESAGLSAGDRILEINGRPIENPFSLRDVWDRRHPGDAIKLTIQRAKGAAPFVIEAVLRGPHPLPKEERVERDVGRDIANTSPLAFLVVGLAVLFLRLEDPNAWLLALLFAGFIAIPGAPNSFAGLNPSLRAFAMAYRALFDNMATPLFYFFFAVFPTRSPLDRRIPWLKWIALLVGAFMAPPAVLGRFSGGRHVILLSFLYGLIALGFVSLIWNAFSAPTPEARRKIRVILWGTLVGVVPVMLVLGANDFFGFHPPRLIFVAMIVLLWLFPLPEEASDDWNGFTRHKFNVDGCPAWVVEPKHAAPGNPWTWCMEFSDAFTGRTGVPKLLATGFFHIHIQVGNTFGCPSALRHFDAFYRCITAMGLAKKGTLIGISRGGLYAYNWAVQNPEKEVCIYGDAPVCDFKSWPGGKGVGKGSPDDWQALMKCYGFKDEREAIAWKGNPVDNLGLLANAGIPLIHVVGDVDDVVPVRENTSTVEQRYKELGGEIHVLHKPHVGHHPHGLDDPQPLVDFILQKTYPARPMSGHGG